MAGKAVEYNHYTFRQKWTVFNYGRWVAISLYIYCTVGSIAWWCSNKTKNVICKITLDVRSFIFYYWGINYIRLFNILWDCPEEGYSNLGLRSVKIKYIWITLYFTIYIARRYWLSAHLQLMIDSVLVALPVGLLS